MMYPHREEVCNVFLAQLLNEDGLVSIPESIQQAPLTRVRSMPDVLVIYQGLRCVIEGEFETTTSSRDRVQKEAVARLESGIAQMAIGILYPPTLRYIPLDELPTALRQTHLSFVLCTDAHTPKWQQGTLQQIEDDLRRAWQFIAADDVVIRAVETLTQGMEPLIDAILAEPAQAERLAQLLGIQNGDSNAAE